MRRFFPVLTNQVAALLLGVLGINLISHVAPPGVYGSYVLFLTLAQLGTLLTHAGLINHTSRYWQRELGQSGGYARFLLRASLEAAPALGVLCLAGGLAIGFDRASWVWVALLLFAANLGWAWWNIANMALNAEGRLWAMCGLGVIATAFRVLLPPLFAVLAGASLLSMGLGYSLHTVVVGVVIGVLFRKAWVAWSPDPSTQEKWRGELRTFGRPFILLGVGGWLLQSADRWVIAAFFGREAAGLFGMAFTIAGIVPMMISAALLQVFFPGIFRKADAARSREDWQRLAAKTDRLTLLFLGGAIAASGAVWLAGPLLAAVLVSENFAGSMPLLFAAGMSVISTQVNQFHYLLLQGQHNSRAMVKVMLVVAAVKTIGTLLAGAISWEAVMGWLIVSTGVVAVLGRVLIHRVALDARLFPKERARDGSAASTV